MTPYTDGKFKTISAGKFDIDSSGFTRSPNIHWFGKFITIKSNVCVRFSDVAALVRSDMNRCYTKNGRLIPTAKRGKEIKQP